MTDKKGAKNEKTPDVAEGPKGSKAVRVGDATFYIRPEVRETFERIERSRQIRRHVLAGLGPFEEHAQVVDLPGKTVPLLEVLGETTLTLESLLGLGLVVPEIRGGDLAFELR